MSTLMLISNPKPKQKGRVTKMATKRNAKGRFVAATKRVRGRPRRAASVPAVVVTAPAARRRRVARRAAGTVANRRRYTRRTGGGRSMQIGSLFADAGIGAVGAVGVDFVYRMLPIPRNLQTGITGAAVKAAATVGLGMLAARAMPGRAVTGAVTGALTVQLHALLTAMMPRQAQHAGRPAGQFAEVDDNPMDINGFDEPEGIGYVPDDGSDMGMYVSEVDTIDSYSQV
ncbi:MAG: hypothetical protein DDT21_02649 [Syntrophomonadaceae bacterium]|nr:hypothetical protein [Bacillota bacterium]